MSVLKGTFNGSVFTPRCPVKYGYTADSPQLDFSGLTPAAITTGSIMGTGSSWIAHSTAGSCGMKLLLSYTATSGEFATLRMRARSNALGAVVCGNFSASAGANDHGDLFALQGYAQPNAYTSAVATRTVCALYGCIDRTSGGTSTGRDWVAWIDTHMQVKSSAGSYLMRLSHNGTVANDGVFTIYNGGRMPYLFTFEDAAGLLTDADGSHSVASGAIAVKTPAGVKYIVLYN
jgi:hypothetical protein